MAHSFTPEQREAIDTRDRTLLVSAAAGSGKTATLTERIIASLTDPQRPLDLSRLVVATFTKDSAADMRKKIAAALQDALARDPQNRHLLRQQLLLPSASISTIDSFCGRLLRRHAEEAGLTSGFRVADPAEDALLSLQVLEELLDELYAGECPEVGAAELCRLSETLTSAKSEGEISAHLHALYEELLHGVRGIEALADARDGYRAAASLPWLKTPFGAAEADRFAGILSGLADAYREAVSYLEGLDERSLATRLPYALEEEALLRRLAALLRTRDENARAAFDISRPSMPAVRKGDCEENRALSLIHKQVLGVIGDIRKDYFAYTDEESARLCRELAEMCDLLYRVLSLYDARFTAEKRRRGLCSFLDIERLTYALLIRDGSPTPLARTLAEGIDGIYIDEFQDVNALQYGIFRAIAKEDDLFTVGDVKQCIYAFRHADPSIFASLRERYPRLAAGGEAVPSTIYFRGNFRCDEPVVRYVNRLAGRLFRLAGGTVAYTEDDDLCYKKLPPVGQEPVRTHIFEMPTPTEGRAYSDAEREALAMREATFVAEEIRHLLKNGRKNNGEPIRPSDITLLFRNRSAMPLFAAALSEVAPVSQGEETDFFLNPEVLLALSLLYTVDNPHRDVYLAAALRSPVFGFTLSELTVIRREMRTAADLYDALCAYLDAHPDFEKGKRFLGRLDSWRRLAEGETVGNLVLTVFREAGLLLLAGRGSEEHHDNLFRLYQYARSFEASSYQGLYNFISYLNTAIENRTTLIKPNAEAKADAVRFMTVHGSKGLEFPVVFFCNTDHTFSTKVTEPPILFDREYGPVCRLLTENGEAIAENPIRTLVAGRLRRAQAEEEIRLLYVALTRARERLYITGASTSLDKKVAEETATLAVLPHAWYILSRSSLLAWILPILSGEGDPYLTLHPLPQPGEVALPEKKETGFAKPAEDKPSADAATLSALLGRRLHFSYPDEALTRLPEKLSVSRLSPTVLDGSEREVATVSLPEEHRPSVPLFLSGRREDEAALSGTATHLFLQFCDLSRLSAETVEEEIARLVTRQFLLPEDAARVRRDEIALFCRSALFSRLRAGTVRREVRFHALLPAEKFAGEADRREALCGRELLVQGVIDCLIEEEDGYVLIDYKTDRLTPTELADPRIAAKKLTERHAPQLSYYAAACRRMYGTPPREVLIYSLPLGDTVAVPLSEEE